MKIIDLHTHSTESDGSLTPSELTELAARAGLSAIALTDHDTCSGLDEAKARGARLGLEVIDGVELVAAYNGGEIHILGYFIDYNGQYFISRLKELSLIRAERNEKLFKRLASLKMELSPKELAAFSGGRSLTRLHFAKAMTARGYVRSIREAFDSYLDIGRPAHVGRNAFDYTECIEIIKRSGGVSSLAHPYLYKWGDGEVPGMLERLKDAGLEAVETLYPTHDERHTAALMRIAKRLGLKLTGGSDFHGDGKPDIKIGTGRGNIEVSYEILEKLRGSNE